MTDRRLGALLAAALVVGCDASTESEEDRSSDYEADEDIDVDAGTDGDADIDSDVDSDTDGDAGGDADGDADGYADGYVDDPGVPPPSALAENGMFDERYGINAHRPTGEWADQLYDRVRDAGITWVRVDIRWEETEPERGVFEWWRSDSTIQAAHARGLHVFATLTSVPGWANSGGPTNVPAEDPADWRRFCREVASRYDGHHGQPRVQVFGLWNEPDGMGLPEEYSDSERLDTYVESILIPGYKGIHADRTDAYVAGPDLARDRGFLVDLLDRAQSALDIVTVHRYSDHASGVIDTLEETRSIMEDAGIFGRTPLWLTETGWSTHSEHGCWADTVDEPTQAERYSELLEQLVSRPWVEKVFFYELIDDDSPGACQWGVLDSDLRDKPAYSTLRDFIAGHDPGHGPAQTTVLLEAEGSELAHGIGHADRDGWAADTGSYDRGHMIYGPYRGFGEGTMEATFRLREDVRDGRDEAVATIDIFDADADEVLASWGIGRDDFASADDWYDFTLRADVAGRGSHRIETRLYWHDRAAMRADFVRVVHQ